MKTIGGVTFPETPEEAKGWEPTINRLALDRRVLVVARTRIEGAWAAYCKEVPGKNHDNEMEAVLTEGSKVAGVMARAMFPQFADIPYASR